MNKLISLVDIPWKVELRFPQKHGTTSKVLKFFQFDPTIRGETAQILASDLESCQQLLAGGDTVTQATSLTTTVMTGSQQSLPIHMQNA